jgi:hypothetical protein
MSGVHKTGGYCWSIPFDVLGVLFLGEVCSAFLPSKKACLAHQFRYPRVGQQYPPVIGAVDHLYNNPIGQCTETQYICSAQITPPTRKLLDSDTQVMLYPRFLISTALIFNVLRSRYSLASITCIALLKLLRGLLRQRPVRNRVRRCRRQRDLEGCALLGGRADLEGPT